MCRDRGRIKWVSMMLPVHVKLLREYNESLDKVEKPVLDEQKYEEFNEVIVGLWKRTLLYNSPFIKKVNCKTCR